MLALFIYPDCSRYVLMFNRKPTGALAGYARYPYRARLLQTHPRPRQSLCAPSNGALRAPYRLVREIVACGVPCPVLLPQT
jgi:hypothetical protein